MRTKKIIPVIILLILISAFLGCGKERALLTEQHQPIESVMPEMVPKADIAEALPVIPEPTAKSDDIPAPTITPGNVASEEPIPEKKEFSCTLSVRCDTILKNMHKLKDSKKEIVPANGVIFEEKEIAFSEGESVFDVLFKVMKESKIHFEFTSTPMTGSKYIEGIGNIYEFDCGELSGWIYKVNGTSADCDSASYILKDGDKVEWVYTCDLGKDIGR